MPTKIDEPLTAKIPADIDQPDKIIHGLTARQLVILSAAGLLASWVYLAVTTLLPVPTVVVAVLPIIASGVVLAIARRDGMGLDRFVLYALRHLRTVKRQVFAPEDVPDPPAWCRVQERLPAPLRLPVRAIRDDGVMELADGGTTAIIRAGTIPFGLRTTAEQAGLVAGFGRWLNSLEAPVQILIRARPIDLSGLVEQITQSAADLPDPALEQGALDHAAFLASLNSNHDLFGRQVLIVLRDEPIDRAGAGGLLWTGHRSRRAAREASATVVVHRAEEAVRSLSMLGINAELLDAPAARDVLADALSPGEDRLSGLAAPGEVITSNPSRTEIAR